MPLSDHEQRILDEIAKQLAEDDPRFAENVRKATPRSHALRRLRVAALGVVAGLALLVTGLFFGLENSSVTVGFGFAGFVVMLLSVLTGVRAFRALGTAVVLEARAKRERTPRRSLRERMDERWQRRLDDDGR
jgi:uncharacterized membrane protein YdfJ with MMPL/SSD domain